VTHQSRVLIKPIGELPLDPTIIARELRDFCGVDEVEGRMAKPEVEYLFVGSHNSLDCSPIIQQDGECTPLLQGLPHLV
jgi:hypothetical protein